MKRNRGMTVVEFSIVLAIALLIAAISIPSLFRNRREKQSAACAMNLEAISTACKRHAAEKGGFPANLDALVPAYLDSVPSCPAGGTYTLGTPEGDPPTCSVHGLPF